MKTMANSQNLYFFGYHGTPIRWMGSSLERLIFSVENFNKNDYSMFPVHVDEWEGFIFINLSDEPEDFDQTFSPINGRFSNWNISDLKTLETKEYEVKGNWKLVIQNYFEYLPLYCYIPEPAAIHNYMGGRNDLFEGPFLGGYMDFNNGKNSIFLKF